MNTPGISNPSAYVRIRPEKVICGLAEPWGVRKHIEKNYMTVHLQYSEYYSK